MQIGILLMGLGYAFLYRCSCATLPIKDPQQLSLNRHKIDAFGLFIVWLGFILPTNKTKKELGAKNVLVILCFVYYLEM